jgi:FkbM family methyltransferase
VAADIEGVKHMIQVIPGTSEVRVNLREDYSTDEIVIREIWEENVYEVDPSRFNKGGVVVDIGANIGSFSLYGAYYGATVYAVEPEPHNLEALRTNINLNNYDSKIIVCPYGISDYKGTAKITDEGGGATIKDTWKDGVDIEIMSLDNLFSLYDIQDVDVLKIDVEGAETEIILGASKENLQKCKFITMEFDIRSGNSLGDMVKKLSETHHVRTMGSWERGGMIWAWIY